MTQIEQVIKKLRKGNWLSAVDVTDTMGFHGGVITKAVERMEAEGCVIARTKDGNRISYRLERATVKPGDLNEMHSHNGNGHISAKPKPQRLPELGEMMTLRSITLAQSGDLELLLEGETGSWVVSVLAAVGRKVK